MRLGNLAPKANAASLQQVATIVATTRSNHSVGPDNFVHMDL